MTLIHLSFGILPGIQPLIFLEVGGWVGGGRRYEMCHFMYHIWAARRPLFTRRVSAWTLSLIRSQIETRAHIHDHTYSRLCTADDGFLPLLSPQPVSLQINTGSVFFFRASHLMISPAWMYGRLSYEAGKWNRVKLYQSHHQLLQTVAAISKLA